MKKSRVREQHWLMVARGVERYGGILKTVVTLDFCVVGNLSSLFFKAIANRP